MNCRAFQKALLTETEPSSPRALERHRSRCAECERFALRFEAARSALERPASPDPSPDLGFSSRVVAALPAAESRLGWAAVRLLPATTALALTLLGWCWLATPSPDEIWTQAGSDEILTWILGDTADDN